VAQEIAVLSGIKRHPQFAVVIVRQRNKAERLQARTLKLARRLQHLCHAVNRARPCMESYFDEISGGKLSRQLQQTAVDGDGLEFCARPMAAFGRQCGRYRSIQLHTVGTFMGVVSGEVTHSQWNYATLPPPTADYESTIQRAPDYTTWVNSSVE
jgi:hypothetical protein